MKGFHHGYDVKEENLPMEVEIYQEIIVIDMIKIRPRKFSIGRIPCILNIVK